MRITKACVTLCHLLVIISTELSSMRDEKKFKYEGKRTLKIDMDGLCSAMDDSSYEHYYYLDLQTGEIVFISDYASEEEVGKLMDEIDENPDHYKPIPRAESYEGYDDMADFIATVEDERLAELLEAAINGKGAFR